MLAAGNFGFVHINDPERVTKKIRSSNRVVLELQVHRKMLETQTDNFIVFKQGVPL